MSKQKQLAALDNMAKYEEMLALLYESFGVQLPERYEFWKRFKDEEEIHAQWIRNLKKEIEKGRICFDDRRFSAKAIIGSISHVRSLKNEAMQGGMDFVRQLQLAMETERRLSDSRYFEIMKNDDPQLKILLDKLRIAADIHRERLFEELEKQSK